MSTRVIGQQATVAGRWGRYAAWGLATFAVAAGIAAYGAYGDPHPKSSQESAVPLIIGIALAVAVVLFGVLLPWLSTRLGADARWPVALSALGVIATPVAFWSGVSIILGAAGVLSGKDATRSPAIKRLAVALGCLAIAAPILITVLGNTVLSR